MKEKTITITVDGTNPGQWSNLLLELNIMKKAWRPFGVNIDLKAPGIKNIIEWGNNVFGVKAAAQYYYNISTSSLSARQSSRLAAMRISERITRPMTLSIRSS